MVASSLPSSSRQPRSNLYEHQNLFVVPLRRSEITMATFLVMALWVVLTGFLFNGGTLFTPLHHYVDHHSMMNILQAQSRELGTVVFLAPQRRQGTMWNIDRFCLLLRAVRSVNDHLNAKFGPYPIHILIAKDFALDPDQKDGPYTAQDRALIRAWAPTSSIYFVEVNMYSQEALEPNMDISQAQTWKTAHAPNYIHGIGYASMCRLLSGRLQQMDFLTRFQYYMRMDDDSLLLRHVPFDPFVKMKEKKLTYAFRRMAADRSGVHELWNVAKLFVPISSATPFLSWDDSHQEYTYLGTQPYNNFHVASVDFWRSSKWKAFSKKMDDHHLFFQHRVGDANVHAIATMLMMKQSELPIELWSEFPCAHNSNDMPLEWGSSIASWRTECETAYATYGINVTKKSKS